VLAWSASTPESEQAHPGYVGVPAVMARASLGSVRWFRGFPDGALAVANESVAKAAAIGEPFSQAMSLSLLAAIHMNRREPEKTLEVASRALLIANDEGFVAWKNRPFLLAQWARVAMGAGDAGALIDEMERTLSCGMGAGPATKTFYKIPFVDLCIRAGRFERALEEVEEAIAFAGERGERAWEPELHRLRGVLLQEKNPEEARRSFDDAIALAAEQSSRSFELRALVSLYRFAPSATVRDRLKAVYASFTEGFDTADLMEARALLG
jgi:tetratricopeptide (TPR) repeat protein